MDALFEPLVVLTALGVFAVPVVAAHAVLTLFRWVRVRWARRP